MKRHRRIKHKRKYSPEKDIKNIILSFLSFRLVPEKHGFGEIIYNNSIPVLDQWLKQNKIT